MITSKPIDVDSLPRFQLSQHVDCFAQEIVGPITGYDRCSFALNTLMPGGYALPHVHEEADHIYYVLKGSFVFDNFICPPQEVATGQALIIRHGITHEIKGSGKEACQYIVCTLPPPPENRAVF